MSRCFVYVCVWKWLVGGMNEFYSVKTWANGNQEWKMDGSYMPKLMITISLPGSLEQWRVFSGRWREGVRGREGEESTLEVLVDDAMVVEVVDSIEDGISDAGRVVLGKLALCEDVVNARLKVLVKLDLKGRTRRWGEHKERYRRCCGGQNSWGQSMSRCWLPFNCWVFTRQKYFTVLSM